MREFIRAVTPRDFASVPTNRQDLIDGGVISSIFTLCEYVLPRRKTSHIASAAQYEILFP